MELTALTAFVLISLINTELILLLWHGCALSGVHLRSEMEQAVTIYCAAGCNA